MGHVKVVQSGKTIELYEYERELPCREKSRKSSRDIYDFTTIKRRGNNLKEQKKNFVRLVRSNLEGVGNPLLVTLTMREIRTISYSYHSFHLFVTKLRQRLGKAFQYIAVPEFQRRGAVHFHVLIWGIDDRYYRTERSTRFFANLWREGFVDIIRTDGSARLAGYLGKYMSKTISDSRLSGKKAYSASRGVKRPAKFSGPIITGYFQEIYGIELSTDSPVHEREYSTQYLGKCNYKVYRIK